MMDRLSILFIDRSTKAHKRWCKPKSTHEELNNRTCLIQISHIHQINIFDAMEYGNSNAVEYGNV